MAKAEAVEFVRRGVRRMKDRAQQIVDDIEANKCEMMNKLDGAGPTCEEAQLAVTTIQPSDVDLLCADDKRCPSHLVAQIMDCVLLMFQRPLNAVHVDEERHCIKPSWNQSVKVRNISYMSAFQLLIFSFFHAVNYFSYPLYGHFVVSGDIKVIFLLSFSIVARF